MRHRNKINHLSRDTAHRKALLMNLSKELIIHKRIITTLAKAKALRKVIEPILTRGKQDTTHSRRMVFAEFQDKVPVKELFNNIVEKLRNRPGGYTRLIKLGNRGGDDAKMCMIELVDYNDVYIKEAKVVKITRRRRKSRPSLSQEANIVATASEN